MDTIQLRGRERDREKCEKKNEIHMVGIILNMVKLDVFCVRFFEYNFS